MHSPSRCLDNDDDTFCHTLNPKTGDPSPTLTVQYQCPLGTTFLPRVEVVNRNDACDVCLPWITAYKADFKSAAGAVEATYCFSAGDQRFNIVRPVNGGERPGRRGVAGTAGADGQEEVWVCSVLDSS